MPKIRFITIEDLLEMKENNEKFKLVEVLAEENYKSGHIPGAINIPLDRINTDTKKILKKNDIIVVYCGSYHCHASTNAVKALFALGYKKVLDYKAGKAGWTNAGLDLE